MKRGSIVVLSLLTAAASHAPASSRRPEHLFGPEPSWEQYRYVAEATITATLFDPESARIQWVGTYRKGFFKPFLAARVEGYVACGVINARNRLGGYVGARAFVVVIDYNRVLYSEIDTSTNGGVTAQCARDAADGMFPAVPTSAAPATSPNLEAPTSSAPTVTTAAGFTLRAMPDGAYVSGVAPGSAAAVAGLKPGMVIGAVNAVPLHGMGDAMLKVIEAAGVEAKVTIIGGGTLNLGAKR